MDKREIRLKFLFRGVPFLDGGFDATAFLTAVARFYGHFGAAWEARRRHLTAYLAGCLTCLEGCASLTPIGVEIKERLAGALEEQRTFHESC